MNEQMRAIKFYGRKEQIPANYQGESYLDALRQLAEEQRRIQLAEQQVEASSFQIACVEYARMLRGEYISQPRLL